jgi:hypothetical protein
MRAWAEAGRHRPGQNAGTCRGPSTCRGSILLHPACEIERAGFEDKGDQQPVVDFRN